VRLHDVVIHAGDAEKINAVLTTFLGESGATEALLIDRSGQLLAATGANRALDTVSISALAAGAFSSTGALARLLGEEEFTVLFHQGNKESIHMSSVDDHVILLAIFGGQTTVGMVWLFAKEVATVIGQILIESRNKPRTIGDLSAPLTAEESRTAFGEPAKP
jgi:predicted regulator of Ras-like GTPase activity (Roadblock/LC7/MglB family)